MAAECPKFLLPATDVRFPVTRRPIPWQIRIDLCSSAPGRRLRRLRISALSGGDGSSSSKKAAAPNSNYVVPLDKSSCITRPLAEVLRDLNKRIPDNIIKTHDDQSTFIPWYHANRMLSFYAPGWCGEIRDVIFSENGSVTVVYRVTIRGSDGEAHRESTGTVSPGNGNLVDPVAAAEEIAFCRACSRRAVSKLPWIVLGKHPRLSKRMTSIRGFLINAIKSHDGLPPSSIGPGERHVELLCPGFRV